MAKNTGFGHRLRTIRKSKGITAVELAEKLGVSVVTITKYENDQMHPKFDKFKKIASILETNVEFLLNGHGSDKRVDNVDTTYEMVRRLIVKESDLKDLQKLLVDFVLSKVNVSPK